MAAFDRVCSGISQMDEQFDIIRLGDNVVWRVDKLEDFLLFVEFTKAIIKKEKKQIS